MSIKNWTINYQHMSNVGPKGRSYLPIQHDDLKQLAKIAREDRMHFFQAHPNWAKTYAHRVLCIALCQGAAKHYLDGTTGINDFDVYTFYRRHLKKPWYAKRHKSYDFGDPKFGQSVDRLDFRGRRVDCWGRAIYIGDGEDVITALRRYFQQGKTKTAKLLAAKAVVMLEPNCGTVVWPLKLRQKKRWSWCEKLL